MKKPVTPAAVTLWWSDSRGEGSLNMGDYETVASAHDAIPGALAELIKQCADDDERRVIRAGVFDFLRVGSDYPEDEQVAVSIYGGNVWEDKR